MHYPQCIQKQCKNGSIEICGMLQEYMWSLHQLGIMRLVELHPRRQWQSTGGASQCVLLTLTLVNLELNNRLCDYPLQVLLKLIQTTTLLDKVLFSLCPIVWGISSLRKISKIDNGCVGNDFEIKAMIRWMIGVCLSYNLGSLISKQQPFSQTQ